MNSGWTVFLIFFIIAIIFFGLSSYNASKYITALKKTRMGGGITKGILKNKNYRKRK
jgi:hypothetical protein